MAEQRGKSRPGGTRLALSAIAVVALATPSWACRQSGGEAREASPPVALRLGISQVSATNPTIGLRQLSGLLTVEGLARAAEDGRMQPLLAESWTAGNEGRSLTIKLRPHVTFPDGALLDAEALATILPESLRSYMGPIASDLEAIRVASPNAVEVTFKHASPFLLETLEGSIQRQGSPPLGTGPYVVAADSPTHLSANAKYYLGKPAIQEIAVTPYPSVRAAWADLLRDRIDMLWEVGPDALDSMTSSSSVSVFTYTRRYQYIIFFNPSANAVRSREVRRALNAAIDRNALVRSALNGHGVASSGVIWPQHWALPADRPTLSFDPTTAAAVLKREAARSSRGNGRIPFTCIIPPDALTERVALEVKRQFEAVGVDMAVEELTQEQLLQRLNKGDYDATLIEFISGPNVFRPYLVWHSNAPINWGHWGSPGIDKALEAVRFSGSDADYRVAMADLIKTFADDPPALFLAWPERARAISKRFSVPSESGRDILSTLRMWKPSGVAGQASHN